MENLYNQLNLMEYKQQVEIVVQVVQMNINFVRTINDYEYLMNYFSDNLIVPMDYVLVILEQNFQQLM